MNIGSIIPNGSFPTNSAKNSTSANNAANNRTTFLEMLLGATSENSVQQLTGGLNLDAANGASSDHLSQLLATLQNSQESIIDSEDQESSEEDIEASTLLDLVTSGQVDSETINALKNEESNEAIIELIMNELLPEYLRTEVEELLNNPQSLPLDGAELSLAQMIAMIFSATTKKEQDRLTLSQTSYDQLKNQLQQALKAEAKVTGINADEIIKKIDQLIVAENKPKQDYLQGLLQRLPFPTKKQSEQVGLNMSTVTDTAQTMSRVQQLVIHIGDQPTKEAEQREFLRQFQNILGKGLLKQLNNGSTQLTIRLHPQHLGKLDIQLVQLNGVITAKITASTKVAKEMIEGQLQQLRNTFVQQQINVDKIEVHQQQSEQQLFNKDGQGKQQEQQQEQQKDKNNNEERFEQSFADVLDQLSINEKV